MSGIDFVGLCHKVPSRVKSGWDMYWVGTIFWVAMFRSGDGICAQDFKDYGSDTFHANVAS